MFCKFCGDKVDEQAVYCHACGKQIKNNQSSTKPETPEHSESTDQKTYTKTEYEEPKATAIKEKKSAIGSKGTYIILAFIAVGVLAAAITTNGLTNVLGAIYLGGWALTLMYILGGEFMPQYSRFNWVLLVLFFPVFGMIYLWTVGRYRMIRRQRPT